MNRHIPLPLALLLLGTTACVSKIPDHLRVEASADQQLAELAPVEDLPAALFAMLRKDPLARSPLLLDPASVDALDGGPPIGAWIRGVRALEKGDGQVERSLQQLEDEHPGTPVVALARGYRLRVVENRLAGGEALDAAAQQDIVTLLTPLKGSPNDEALPRPPLEWLAPKARLADAARTYGDRWVLTGWLQAPGIPLDAAAESLSAPMYDGLAKTPTGALLQARARGADAPIEGHLEDLTRATRLALHHAAADRDKEQAAWAAMKAAAAEELEVDDPVGVLLARSRDGLTAGAGADAATGGALLAIASMRWKDVCGTPPCVGLDRVETMRFAGRWSDEIAPLAAVWQVIALKEALDTMEVGHETVLYPKAIVSLVDALIGTGAGPLDVHLLRRSTPDASVWLALGRSVGTEAVTQWSEARVALGAHLEAKVQEALEVVEDPELRPLLERIGARAIP